MRGLWQLTWLEMKIFLREPLGAIGTILVPVALFVVLGRAIGGRIGPDALARSGFLSAGLPVFAALFISINAVLSLVTIISIYREGGILKRLRATPLRPQTILAAHVVVKMLLTLVTLGLMYAAGARYYPLDLDAPLLSFALALFLATGAVLSMGFVIASVVPTARFAQPVGAFVLYPMVALSGLFTPIASMPAPLQSLARVLPMTYAVSLLQGIWTGESWSAHVGDAGALLLVVAVCAAVSAKLFRWE